MLTLKEACKIIFILNRSSKYNAFFSNGKLVIEERLITIGV